jgi:hypothetical protein
VSSQVPTLQFINFNGIAAAGSAPSDSNGAVGHTQYVEAVNRTLTVFTKGVPGVSQPTVVTSLTLSGFFGSSESLFDPRVIYDARWQRWVVVASRRAASSIDTVKKFHLAVSSTNSASGSWCVYTVNFFGGLVQNGDWWDFPQLGMDLDGLILTGNIFHFVTSTSNTFRTAALMPLSKAQVYNCLGFSVPKFESGLISTLAPPIVRDLNSAAHIISANGVVRKWTLTNSSRNPGATLTGPVTIGGIASFVPPPDAQQPGTTSLLDTADGRFSNASTQIGSELWNTHAINVGGLSKVRWYRINTGTNFVVQQGTIPTSTHDFNASIAVNDASNAFLAFTSSSVAVRAQVRFSGKLNGDAAVPAGTSLLTSTFSMLTGTSGLACNNVSTAACRWGDYSAVSIDPSDTTKAWIVNQFATGTSQFNWGTRIARIGQ